MGAGRAKEFMSQLAYSPHKTVIAVGHSHFFRELLKEFQADAFKAAKPKLAAELGKELLENCGVAKVTLDASVSADAPIVDVELVFGCGYAKKKGFVALIHSSTNCCVADKQGFVEPAELVFSPSTAEELSAR